MDNTNNEILYSSVEEQIEKLKQQNLIIEDEDYAGQNVLGLFLDVAQMDTTKTRPLTKYDSGIFASGTAVLTDLAQGMSAEDALQTVKDDVAGKYPELEIN